jgi:hypothetical protein
VIIIYKGHFKRPFQCFINLCLRTISRCFAGRMWSAGKASPMPALWGGVNKVYMLVVIFNFAYRLSNLLLYILCKHKLKSKLMFSKANPLIMNSLNSLIVFCPNSRQGFMQWWFRRSTSCQNINWRAIPENVFGRNSLIWIRILQWRNSRTLHQSFDIYSLDNWKSKTLKWLNLIVGRHNLFE